MFEIVKEKKTHTKPRRLRTVHKNHVVMEQYKNSRVTLIPNDFLAYVFKNDESNVLVRIEEVSSDQAHNILSIPYLDVNVIRLIMSFLSSYRKLFHNIHIGNMDVHS